MLESFPSMIEPAMTDVFTKETDGFFARHFDRKISGAISRALLRTPVAPNQITLAVTFLGIVAGACMARPGYAPKLWGALLFLATSILDGCDGEVARAKQMTSRLGGWLDLWGDNVVHMAVFYGLGRGLFKDTGLERYAVLGAVAALGTLVSASIASYQTYQSSRLNHPSPPPSPPRGEGVLDQFPLPRGERVQGEGDNRSFFTSVVGDARRMGGSAWKARWARWSDALARRDFVYGVVALALIGHLEWFLWACAVGVVLYSVVLILLATL